MLMLLTIMPSSHDPFTSLNEYEIICETNDVIMNNECSFNSKAFYKIYSLISLLHVNHTAVNCLFLNLSGQAV